MYKELHELLVRMKISLSNDDRIVLTKKELNMIIKYINELEI